MMRSLQAQLCASESHQALAESRQDRARFALRCGALRMAIKLHEKLEAWNTVLTNRTGEAAP